MKPTSKEIRHVKRLVHYSCIIKNTLLMGINWWDISSYFVFL